jgi:protease YdgD
MWRTLFLALLYSWLIGAIAAEAQTPTSTDLTNVNVSAYPWSSIAKLNNSVGGSCTAVAIDEDTVLTAAHCIFNRRTNRFLPPSALHLLFGYERGQYVTHGLVNSYVVGPGYDPTKEFATISSDWAILKLAQSLPNTVQPLQFVDRMPTAGSSLVIASYAGKRLHVMTADTNCQLLSELPGSKLIEHNCKEARGSSGAPLLVMEHESALIVGIQVAIGRHNGADVMLAISAPSISDNLQQSVR